MKIKGKKVYLTEGITENGYSSFLKWFTDIDVMRYIGFAKRVLGFKTIEEVKSFVSELDDGIFFEIYAYDNLIGYTSLSRFDGDECELGIVIGEKEYWNKGLGQEATRLTMGYAFGTLGMKRIVLSTSGLHEAAIRMYESCGFKIYVTKKDARDVFDGGKWVKSDTVEMEMLRE